MKGFVASIAVAAALLGFGLSNHAQAQTLGVNCSALSGTPFMCVKNASNYPVTSIQASNGQSPGARWISMPGGTLNPGETTIVKFDTAGNGWGNACTQNVFVRDRAGQSHPFRQIDVCHGAGLVIR